MKANERSFFPKLVLTQTQLCMSTPPLYPLSNAEHLLRCLLSLYETISIRVLKRHMYHVEKKPKLFFHMDFCKNNQLQITKDAYFPWVMQQNPP